MKLFLLAPLSFRKKTLIVVSPTPYFEASDCIIKSGAWIGIGFPLFRSCIASISVSIDILVLHAFVFCKNGFLESVSFVASEVTDNEMNLVILLAMLKSTFLTH